ncbi:MAG TPA: hypothetical protein VFS92_08750 [Planctomycetota bacterium]|nr:hypothetical protein [Planctomycetota bacterium]
MTQGSRAAILGAALAAAFGATTARAQPFTGNLDPIQAAVAARLAVFPEPQTRAESAQRRALEKCIRSYERNSTSPDRDMATLGSIANLLDRAFPGDPEFGPTLDGALDAFRQEIEADRVAIEEFLPAIDTFSSEYVRTVLALEKLEVALLLADEAETRKAAATALRKARKASIRAWKSALDLQGIFARLLIDKVGVGRMTALVDAEPYDAQAMFAGYAVADQVLFVESIHFNSPLGGGGRAIGFGALGVTGPGVYPLDAIEGSPTAAYREFLFTLPFVSVGDFVTLDSGTPYTGTLTITTFDLERRLVEGTFEFTAFDENQPPGSDTRAITDGAFRSQLRLRR